MFFIISGYFIYQNALSRSVLSYIIAKIVRMMPDLLGSVLFRVIIGSIYTNISVARHIISPLTRQFMFSIFVYVNLYLEGVFVYNPYKCVINGNLWTLPIGVVSYILVLVVAVKHGIKTQASILGCAIVVTYEITKILVETNHDYIVYSTAI